LSTADDEPQNNEDWVLENAFEDVKLIVDLSCSDHVKDLHEDESCEDEGQVTGWSNCLLHFGSVEF